MTARRVRDGTDDSKFRDRRDAGHRLAQLLRPLAGEHPVVVGLPRGGVPVAAEVARALRAPLDVIVVRKLGVPWQPELGMGAIGEGGVRVLNERIVAAEGVSADQLAEIEQRERLELERRALAFRGGRPMIELSGRTVIVVDDGIATGGTARAALQVARAHGARKVVLAVPVAPPETVEALLGDADEVVAVETPRDLWAIGAWYQDFTQTTDDEVVACLAGGERTDREVDIEVDGVRLGGHLCVPPRPRGVVVFAHGSGSSRRSPRNQLVARVLQDAGIATLLFDLLTDDEASRRSNVFDIDLLARRLIDVTAWLRAQPETAGLALGYFGASTGAAAALGAAAEPGSDVTAVVSRGGRPDLAMAVLRSVTAPTLLIVGGDDTEVLELNHEAARHLVAEHHVAVVTGATHLFEEPGTLEEAAGLARDWFADRFDRRSGPVNGSGPR